MLFSKMKEKLKGGLKSLSGRKDALEAVCAAIALVTYADGEASDVELKAALLAVSANPSLTQAYKPAEIERTMDAMLKRATSGRVGRMSLFKEIDDIASDVTIAEMVYLCALDVAEADSAVGEQEKKVLKEVAKRLGVNEASMQV